VASRAWQSFGRLTDVKHDSSNLIELLSRSVGLDEAGRRAAHVGAPLAYSASDIAAPTRQNGAVLSESDIFQPSGRIAVALAATRSDRSSNDVICSTDKRTEGSLPGQAQRRPGAYRTEKMGAAAARRLRTPSTGGRLDAICFVIGERRRPAQSGSEVCAEISLLQQRGRTPVSATALPSENTPRMEQSDRTQEPQTLDLEQE